MARRGGAARAKKELLQHFATAVASLLLSVMTLTTYCAAGGTSRASIRVSSNSIVFCGAEDKQAVACSRPTRMKTSSSRPDSTTLPASGLDEAEARTLGRWRPGPCGARARRGPGRARLSCLTPGTAPLRQREPPCCRLASRRLPPGAPAPPAIASPARAAPGRPVPCLSAETAAPRRSRSPVAAKRRVVGRGVLEVLDAQDVEACDSSVSRYLISPESRSCPPGRPARRRCWSRVEGDADQMIAD